MEVTFNAPIDRGFQFTYTLADADDFTAGQVFLLGPNVLALVVERAEGATAKAVTIAAGDLAQPGVATLLLTCEDVTMAKLAGVDSIADGTKMWYSVDDDALVSALSEVDASGACYACACSIELSNDTADTVRVSFDGRFTVSEAGTG